MTGATLKALNPVIAGMQKAAGLNSNPGNYSNFVTWQVGFTFQAPLGMRAPLANTRQAQYSLLRARAYLQQVVHQTTHSLARFFLEIDANFKQFKTASRLRAAAAIRLESARAMYEEGRWTQDRFLDAVATYATAVANEAQYKTTYNISIVALEEAKGTLLAYDNIAVAEGAHPAKAYRQAADIQGAHRRFSINPDGPQISPRQVGPLNTDPVDNNPPPGVDPPSGDLPLPAPAGPLGPRPQPIAPYSPARLLPDLSQTTPAPGSARPGRLGAQPLLRQPTFGSPEDLPPDPLPAARPRSSTRPSPAWVAPPSPIHSAGPRPEPAEQAQPAPRARGWSAARRLPRRSPCLRRPSPFTGVDRLAAAAARLNSL